MSCRRLGEKSILVKANDLKCLFNAGVFVSMAYLGASVLNISKEKCVHGPAERQFNVVAHKVTFEKFECNYRCTINSMNSVFMSGNAKGPWTELLDSMYQMQKKKTLPTLPTEFQTETGYRERSGSVVECLTQDRRAAGSGLTGVTALWSLNQTHLS